MVVVRTSAVIVGTALSQPIRHVLGGVTVGERGCRHRGRVMVAAVVHVTVRRERVVGVHHAVARMVGIVGQRRRLLGRRPGLAAALQGGKVFLLVLFDVKQRHDRRGCVADFSRQRFRIVFRYDGCGVVGDGRLGRRGAVVDG